MRFFLPTVTGLWGAWTKNTCLCLSPRHFSLFSLPRSPVGRNTLAFVQTALHSAAHVAFSKGKICCHLCSTRLHLNHRLLLLGQRPATGVPGCGFSSFFFTTGHVHRSFPLLGMLSMALCTQFTLQEISPLIICSRRPPLAPGQVLGSLLHHCPLIP